MCGLIQPERWRRRHVLILFIVDVRILEGSIVDKRVMTLRRRSLIFVAIPAFKLLILHF